MTTFSHAPRLSRVYCLVTAGLLGGTLCSLALLLTSCLHAEIAGISPRAASGLLAAAGLMFAVCFQSTLRHRDAWSLLGAVKAILAILLTCLEGVFRLFTPLGQHGG